MDQVLLKCLEMEKMTFELCLKLIKLDPEAAKEVIKIKIKEVDDKIIEVQEINEKISNF